MLCEHGSSWSAAGPGAVEGAAPIDAFAAGCGGGPLGPGPVRVFSAGADCVIRVWVLGPWGADRGVGGELTG